MHFVSYILIVGPDLPQVGNELPQFNLEQFIVNGLPQLYLKQFHSLLMRVIRKQYIAH